MKAQLLVTMNPRGVRGDCGSSPTFLNRIYVNYGAGIIARTPDEVDIDGRVKYGMVDSIVHVEVLVIVLPPSGTKYLKNCNCILILKIPT